MNAKVLVQGDDRLATLCRAQRLLNDGCKEVLANIESMSPTHGNNTEARSDGGITGSGKQRAKTSSAIGEAEIRAKKLRQTKLVESVFQIETTGKQNTVRWHRQARVGGASGQVGFGWISEPAI